MEATMTNTLVLRPAWTPLTVALMVLGFVVFWPLGLAMLAYILWGDHFHRMADDARAQFRSGPWGCGRSHRRGHAGPGGYGPTGNVAFDEYRSRELERLEAERAKLEAMRTEFDEFLRELRRARDKEEFDRFMADRERRTRDAE
jgi:hypothetical protein